MKFIIKNKLASPRAEIIQLGRLFDEVASEAFRTPPSRRTFPLLLEIYRNKTEIRRKKFGDYFEKRSETDHQILSQLYQSPIFKMQCQMTQYAFKNHIEDLPPLTGRIDLILRDSPHDYYLVDLKYDKLQDTSSGKRVEDYLQLIFYILGLPDNVRDKISILAYYYFLSGELAATTLGKEILSEGRDLIKRTIIEFLEAKAFPYRSTSYCELCGLRYVCPGSRQGGKAL